MSIDTAIRNEYEKREREFHATLVRNGLRPQGSKLEDYRENRAPVEVPAVKPAGRQSEAAE